MAERGEGDALEIVHADGGSPVEQGAALGAEDERLGGAGAGADADEAVDLRGGELATCWRDYLSYTTIFLN